MIGTIVAHLRNDADRAALDAHLWKTAGQVPRLLEMAHVEASTTSEAMGVMGQLRDGAPRALIGGWHIVVSPRSVLRPPQIRMVVDAIVTEYAAVGHPRIVWGHADKPRAKAGGADAHLHLVIGHVGRTLRALNMSHCLMRLEKVMRVMERDLGEPATLGRHHGPVLDALRGKRDDVADWLIEAHGASPERPRARITSRRRAALTRAGLDAPKLLAAIEHHWHDVRRGPDAPAAFQSRLRTDRLRIEPGRTAAVIIRHEDGSLVCSLDRVVPDAVAALNNFLTHPQEIVHAERSPVAGTRPASGPGPEHRGANSGRDRSNERASGEGGQDKFRNPRDSHQRRGERSGADDRSVDQGHRGDGRHVATDRIPDDGDRVALGRALLTLIVRAGASNHAERLRRSAELLTERGRVTERLRIAGRLQVRLARIQELRLNLYPEPPATYLPALDAVREAHRAVRETAETVVKPAAPPDAAKAPPLTKRFLGRLFSSSGHRSPPIPAVAEERSPKLKDAHRKAQQALAKAQRDLARIEASHAKAEAAAEKSRNARLVRLDRSTSLTDAALFLLAGEEDWARRGPRALMRAAQRLLDPNNRPDGVYEPLNSDEQISSICPPHR